AGGTEVSSVAQFEYTMPAHDVSLTANFETQHTVPDEVEVTFIVDMQQVRHFSPGVDKVFFTGSMFGYAIPGKGSEEQQLLPTDNPLVLSRTLRLAPGKYYYKYYLNEGLQGAEWPTSPIRIAEVSSSGQVFPDVFGQHELITQVAPTQLDAALVYPVPARHTLYVVSGGNEPILEIRMFNLVGQPVYSSGSLTTDQHEINVDRLKPGLYIVQMLRFSGWSVKKVQVIGE
ncbi:MAG: T9SS type A sorting domain-containing protein, partial [Bacteroidales bacterium]